MNPSNVVQCLLNVFPESKCTPISQLDCDAASQIIEFINSGLGDYILEEDLDFDLLGIDDNDVYSEGSTDQSDGEWYEPEPKKKEITKYSIEQMEAIVKMKDELCSFSTIQHRFRKLCHEREISRMRRYLEEGGTNYMKYAAVEQYVYEEFLAACKAKHLVVHNRDLIETACLAAEKFGIPNFQGSSSWVKRFKCKYCIVSQKIMKFVTQKVNAENCDIEQLSKQFLADAKVFMTVTNNMKTYNENNTNQTGINLEMHTGRTLNLKGEKTIEALIQRANAITHSYTLQPVISSDGHLQSPMLLCLFEPKGEPNKFANELAEFTNLFIVSTKSGLLTAALEKKWMKEVFLPKAEDHSLLLLDLWSGYKQSIEDPEVKNKLWVKVIPPKTTGQLQPLDVFFNRQFKSFICDLSDRIRKRHGDFLLSKRVNIAKLISLIHYQFMAPQFNYFAFAMHGMHSQVIRMKGLIIFKHLLNIV